MGVHSVGGSMQEAQKFIAEERERWAEVIRSTNIKIE